MNSLAENLSYHKATLRCRTRATLIVAAACTIVLAATNGSFGLFRSYDKGTPLRDIGIPNSLSGLFEEFDYSYGYESSDHGWAFFFLGNNEKLSEFLGKLADVDLKGTRAVLELCPDDAPDPGFERDKKVRYRWVVFEHGHPIDLDAAVVERGHPRLSREELVVRLYARKRHELEDLSVPERMTVRLHSELLDFVREHHSERQKDGGNESIN